MAPPRDAARGAEAGLLSLLCTPLLALASHALRFPRRWLAGAAAVTLAATLALPGLEIRTDGAALDLPDDPVVRASREDHVLFGDADPVIVLVQSRPGGAAVASAEGLAVVARLHDRLREVPGVRASGVRSVASVPDLRVGEDTFSAEPFLASIPEDPGELELWLRRLRSQPATNAILLGADGTAAALYLPAAEGADRGRLVADVSRHFAADPPEGFDWTLTGPLVAESLLGAAVLEDLARLVPAMAVVLGIVLAFVLRSPGALLLVMAEVGLVLAWTFGGLAVSGRPLTLVTTPLPVILLAMAISDEVHVLERLQVLLGDALARGEDPRSAVVGSYSVSLLQLARPLVATTLTTCAGLLSFTVSGLPALRTFGAAGAFGVALALLASFTVIPALAAVLPPRSLLRIGTAGASRSRADGGRFGAAVLRRPGAAAAGALVVIAAAAPGLARLEVGDNWLENFAPDAAPVTADRAFNRHFWGSYRLDVVLEGRPELFYRPQGARLVETTSALAAAVPGVSGTLSYLDAVEVVMRAHGEQGTASSLSAERLADFAVLAAMTEDPGGAGGFVTADGAHSRVRLFLRGEDFARDRALLDRLRSGLDPLAERHGMQYHFSGDIPKGLRMVREIVRHQLAAVGLSYLLIGLIALTLYPRGVDGLVVLAPLFASVLVVFGVMGYAGIRLGIATAMFSSLTIGVGVDLGLHLAAAWRTARARGEAAATALRAAGRAVRWNAVVLATGFGVLALSALRPNHALGLLLVLGIVTAYLLTILLLPTLLALRIEPWRRPAGGPRPGTAVLLLALAAGLATPAPAAAEGAEAALMAEVERRFSGSPRVVRMAIVTTRPAAVASAVEPPREEVVLWGVLAGDGAATDVLFVFAEPHRLAGIGLLLRNRAGRPDDDEIWYRMRTFDRFRRIPRSSRKLRVPGTALTYEDAHGFLSANRYDFAPAPAGEAPGRTVQAGTAILVARPGPPGLAADVGFASARIAVDRSRRLVTRVEVRSADGRALRSYRVERSHRLGELWLPERATVEDVASGVVSRIDYRYWPVDALPQDLFSTGPDETPLLERLRPVLAEVGALQPAAAAAGARSRSDP